MGEGARIGVYVCHCGCNIEATVDVTSLSAWAARDLAPRGVVTSRDYAFMCSRAGCDLIVDDAKENGVDRVVIAGCWPFLRDSLFRETLTSAGIAPGLFEIVPIRETVAWVYRERHAATAAAKEAIAAAVERIRTRAPGDDHPEPYYEAELVVGGGMAGLRAALQAAEGGRDVFLVEREPSIGGYMAQLEETFASPGCLPCLLRPRMIEAGTHPRVTLLPFSEIEKVDGHAGRFEVTVRKKARQVDPERCDVCGKCFDACHKHVVDAAGEAGLGYRKAIYTPFTGAVPETPVVDEMNCTRFAGGICEACQAACPRDAIDLERVPEFTEVQVGRILLANSCLLERSARNYYGSLLAAQGPLGVSLDSVADWNRCRAAESLGIGPAPAYDLIAWDMTRASRDASRPPLTPGACTACYLNFDEHGHRVSEGPSRPDVLDYVSRDIGPERVRHAVVRPLRGLRVAPYLGCIARYGGDPEKGYDAGRLERFRQHLQALGAEVVDFPLATHCCGGHLSHLSPETALELIRRLVTVASGQGADVMAAACPLCQMNVDAYQSEMRTTLGVRESIPIVFAAQLTALAFGQPPERLGLGTEFVSPAAALAKTGIAIPKPPDDSMRRPPSRRDKGLPMGPTGGRG